MNQNSCLEVIYRLAYFTLMILSREEQVSRHPIDNNTYLFSFDVFHTNDISSSM